VQTEVKAVHDGRKLPQQHPAQHKFPL